MVMVQPELPEDLHGEHAGRAWVYVAVDDPDAHYDRAKVAGAEVLGEPHDGMGGHQRGYSARDLEGSLWSARLGRQRREPVGIACAVARPSSSIALWMASASTASVISASIAGPRACPARVSASTS
jgi:hypothetical protein